MFAVGAFAFLFYVFRQERRNRELDEADESGVDSPEGRRGAEAKRRAAARPRADHEVED